MKKELIDYIRSLSENDKKTLSQKALKACEEVGELAKAILPYDGAHGTNHRFVRKEDIIEEGVDTILCALSIIYSLGTSDEELEDMLIYKSGKWGTLQINEDSYQKDSKFSLPFELHVTVKLEEEKLEKFKDLCKKIGCKPVYLDMLSIDGKTKELMTESRFFGNNREAYAELRRIAIDLRNEGFKIIREKIETVPWHPAAPKENGSVQEMPKDGYFEAHLSYDLPKDNYLNMLVNSGYNISVNLLKSNAETTRALVTIRSSEGNYEEFAKLVKHKVYWLWRIVGEEPRSELHEFSIYDTNVSHDLGWIKQETND
jgi:NTP pyrophosphatase (non-canonical NTP hydrolase)